MRVNCARHIKKQCAKDMFLNLNFYLKEAQENINVRAASCAQKPVSAPKFATCTHVHTHRKIVDKNGSFNLGGRDAQVPQ